MEIYNIIANNIKTNNYIVEVNSDTKKQKKYFIVEMDMDFSYSIRKIYSIGSCLEFFDRNNVVLKPINNKREFCSAINKIREACNNDMWNKIYDIVKTYHDVYGDLNSSFNFKTLNGYSYDSYGYNIRDWIETQKRNVNLLNKNQIYKLTSIGVDLIDLKDWNKFVYLMKVYYRNNKSYNVPLHFKTFDGINYDRRGFKLGLWNCIVTYLIKNDRTDLISKDKINSLYNMGMNYKSLDILLTYYNLLNKYHNKNGNDDVPFNFNTLNGVDYFSYGYELGKWVSVSKVSREQSRLSQYLNNNNIILDTKINDSDSILLSLNLGRKN